MKESHIFDCSTSNIRCENEYYQVFKYVPNTVIILKGRHPSTQNGYIFVLCMRFGVECIGFKLFVKFSHTNFCYNLHDSCSSSVTWIFVLRWQIRSRKYEVMPPVKWNSFNSSKKINTISREQSFIELIS